MSSKPRFAFVRRARFKLTLYYTSILLIFLGALCGLLYYRNYRSMVRELEKFLKDEANVLMAYVYAHPGKYTAIGERLHYESTGERYYKLSYRLLDAQGKTLASSSYFREGLVQDIKPETLSLALADENQREYLTLPGRPSRHLLITRPFPEPATGKVGYIVQILAYLEPLDKLARRFLLIVYSVVPALVLLAWVGGYTLARHVLRPINLMARTARIITSARLDERLVRSKSGDEFDMLAATLNEMIERLEASFGLLRQFAADAAHELRTPLTIMKGEAEIALRSDTADPEAYRTVLVSNIRECDRMIGVITSLLLLAQADAGDIPMKLEPFRLDPLLRELAETFQILAEEANVALEAEAFPEIVVDADGLRLHELFANLLDNAVKYTPPGGRIAVSCELTDREVRVAMADTGEGIPEPELEKIFDRFYRVDASRSRETGGSGLGLSIAQWIARAHSGSIEVESAPGAGSTFTVVLPLHGVPPAEPPELPPAE